MAQEKEYQTSFRLEIYTAEGEFYWREHADLRADLERWLANEKAKPYSAVPKGCVCKIAELDNQHNVISEDEVK